MRAQYDVGYAEGGHEARDVVLGEAEPLDECVLIELVQRQRRLEAKNARRGRGSDLGCLEDLVEIGVGSHQSGQRLGQGGEFWSWRCVIASTA